MQFDIITIFPKIFNSYFNESILKRAQKRHLVSIKTHNLRAFSYNKHKKVDDTPYGGGAGMVMMAEPILRAIDTITKKLKTKNKKLKTKIILFSAKGKLFNQKMAYDWSRKYGRVIFISGRYEGIDERVAQILKKEYKKDFEELSIGPYVLTDGDAATIVVVSALTRLIPNVINWSSLADESFLREVISKEAKTDKLEYPHYTRPKVFAWPSRRQGKKSKKYIVPKILLSGHHQKISSWRKSKMK